MTAAWSVAVFAVVVIVVLVVVWIRSVRALLGRIERVVALVADTAEVLATQAKEALATARMLTAQAEVTEQSDKLERLQTIHDRQLFGRLEAEGQRVAQELSDAKSRATDIVADPAHDAGAAADAASISPPENNT